MIIGRRGGEAPQANCEAMSERIEPACRAAQRPIVNHAKKNKGRPGAKPASGE
jgi:hypothetical protein